MEGIKALAGKKHHVMMVGIFVVIIVVVVGVQSKYKEERLTSVFNVCISFTPSHSSPPSSVGISVGGVSLDLCLLMLTAANLLRPTTKASWQ